MVIGRQDATIDHDEVRRGVERLGGKPARLRGSAGGEDLGLLDLDFSGGRDDQLEPISWYCWFQAFEADYLALVIPAEDSGTAAGRPAELVSRPRR
jgi:hypothetical protein